MGPIPDARAFFLTVPPYAEFPIAVSEFADVLKIQFFHGTIDAHCLECGKDAVFQSTSTPLRAADTGPRTSGSAPPITVEELQGTNRFATWPYSLKRKTNPAGNLQLAGMEGPALEDRTFEVTFACTRNDKHELIFFFRVHRGSIAKVGQAPSLADLHTAGTGKYRKVLGNERYREFTKAIGLSAHGIGIGAFVYLRRIFEGLIETARRTASGEAGWDPDAFARARMDDKILLLKGALPPFLVESRQMYSILSRGIHELSEDQCLTFFEPLKTGIELILDEEIERRERTEKIERTRTALAAMKGKLGSA